jgi:hypothetical protein
MPSIKVARHVSQRFTFGRITEGGDYTSQLV